MKNTVQKLILAKVANYLKRAAIAGVTDTCHWDFYQPEIPEQLREKILKE